MEIGKPDQVRKVGEEAIGALSLPRPDGEAIESVSLPRPEGASGCALFLLLTLLTIYFFWVLDYLEVLMTQKLLWRPEIAERAALLLGVACLAGVLLVGFTVRRHRPPIKLRIEKRSRSFASGEEQFEIWNGMNVFTRALSSLFWVFIGLCLFWLVVLENLWSERLSGLIGLLMCGYMIFSQMRLIFSPLLAANSEGISLIGRFIAWEQIQSIEVEHTTNFDGGFNSVKFTLVEMNGRKIGRVKLAKGILSATQEKELLEFFARRLGRRVLPVAQDGPDWI